jgi:catechol 2,3-dioxygenase-like lactoylglutathione lyase family enzyme
MITRLSHVTYYVLDQQAALEFYTKKLGFKVRTDATVGHFRWLTVGPKTAPELEIVLMPIRPSPMMDEAACDLARQLLKKGILGGGVFKTDNCQKAYEELKAKGVEFMGPPQERPYGIEAVFKDNSGNWFSLCQHS